jgi:thioredoxin reductase
MKEEKYDVLIIGGGPAGLSAAIYAARYNLKAVVLSKNMGGLAATAHKICNFPTHHDIKGFELMQRFTEHVKNLGVKIIFEEVKTITGKDNNFSVKTNKNTYKTKKIIIGAGTQRKRLDVPGEGKLSGRGVSYCATCDAPFYKNKKVIVVGGGDAALTAALLLVKERNFLKALLRS